MTCLTYWSIAQTGGFGELYIADCLSVAGLVGGALIQSEVKRTGLEADFT